MRFPAWKYVLIVLVMIISILYSLPNLYPDEPALQVSGAQAATPIDEALLKRAAIALDEAKIAHHGDEVQAKGVLVRLKTPEDQVQAQAVLRRALGENYVVALNLAPTTPEWLSSIGAKPMKLGLDLRGGVHFKLEVDVAKALEQRQETYVTDIKKQFRDASVAYRAVAEQPGGLLEVRFANAKDRDAGQDVLRRQFSEFTLTPVSSDDGPALRLDFTPEKRTEITNYAVNQNLTTLRNRINELGVAEAVIQRQGASRIVVELPGLQDTAEAKRILGRTASLEFRFTSQAADTGFSVPAGAERFNFNRGGTVLLERRKIVTGERVTNAQSSFDEYSRPQVNINLDTRGGRLMADATRDSVGRQMAVLFVENKQRLRYETDAEGKAVEIREPYIERRVINVATVQSMLGSQFRITGLDSPVEAQELALLLRAGALAAPMYFVEERTIGPSLGQDNIEKGMFSTQLGFLLVALIMLAVYKGFGLIANVALFLNVAILVAVMGALGAALSLPGIAGIVLTIGMAVDANVLICERIREEIRRGLSPQAAIVAGYDRAYGTILDANLTTLIVAIILFGIGTGPIKGFAVTLAIGIATSMFTAITVTRAIVQLAYGGRRVSRLSI
ncbi:protein translocase subunit SecD [Amnimonas aquatica]|uniref:Protein translocase subunit SecD n=1 Tax=Amnimonas aquatica TaxID=2094561 RepID=A0A2P6ASK3_9GAMM|nr:protein translocase subunit SecD [Amnimonas aquatica]PQA42915.1 protein translocase subunit SecD [Amnimonas aquatica]